VIGRRLLLHNQQVRLHFDVGQEVAGLQLIRVQSTSATALFHGFTVSAILSLATVNLQRERERERSKRVNQNFCGNLKELALGSAYFGTRVDAKRDGQLKLDSRIGSELERIKRSQQTLAFAFLHVQR
jgi:hypothetical protein